MSNLSLRTKFWFLSNCLNGMMFLKNNKLNEYCITHGYKYGYRASGAIL